MYIQEHIGMTNVKSDLIPSKGTEKKNEDLVGSARTQSTYDAHFCLKQYSKTMRTPRKHWQYSKQAPVENISRDLALNRRAQLYQTYLTNKHFAHATINLNKITIKQK